MSHSKHTGAYSDDGYMADSETNNIKLHQAYIKGNKYTVEHLAKQEPRLINTRDDEGNTPFHIAAEKLDLSTIKLFLEHGGNPFLENASQLTPAMILYKMSENAKAAKIKIDFCEIYTVFSNHFSKKHPNLDNIMVKNTGSKKDETINIMEALFYGDITFKEAKEKYNTDMSNRRILDIRTLKEAPPPRGRSLERDDTKHRIRDRNAYPPLKRT